MLPYYSTLITAQLVDVSTNEPIGSAHVYAKNRQPEGVTTSANGYFSLAVNPFETIVFSHVSYGVHEFRADQIGNIVYIQSDNVLDEVVVDGNPKKPKSNYILAKILTGLSLAALAIAAATREKPQKVNL